MVLFKDRCSCQHKFLHKLKFFFIVTETEEIVEEAEEAAQEGGYPDEHMLDL